jgi:hypothetical protein
MREDIAGVRCYADFQQFAHAFLDFLKHKRLGFFASHRLPLIWRSEY